MTVYLSLILFGALEAAIGVLLWLYLREKREIQELRKDFEESRLRMEGDLARLRTSLLNTESPPAGGGKRHQILRMHRHGDPPEHIARSLNVPIADVLVALKMDALKID